MKSLILCEGKNRCNSSELLYVPYVWMEPTLFQRQKKIKILIYKGRYTNTKCRLVSAQ